MEEKKRFHEIEERYRALLDRSIYCVYVHDLEGRFLDANDATLNLLGYRRDEIGSLNFASILDEDQLPEAYENIKVLSKTGASKEAHVYRLRKKSGEHVWVEADAAVIYRQGKPYAIQGVGKDVTGQRRAEEALRESENKYRRLFDDSVDAIFITSRKGDVLDANPALLKLFGYTKEELIGKINVRELYADPKDREIFQRRIEKKGSLRDHEVKFRRRTGAEIECHLTASVRRSVEGKIRGYQGIIRDVTEQKRIAEALREREAHYRAMVEAFDGLIYICSQDYRVEFMNQRLMERTGHDATGEPCHEALHNLNSICPWCVNERVFKGETVRWEVLSPRDNRWHYIVNTPIYHVGGAISKQAMILDITDRKRMEEELKESSEKIKFFAYSVSHDLKGPAISTRGFAKRLHELYGDLLDERGKRYCDHIMTAAEQIGALVDQINLFISAKEALLNIEVVNVKEVLRIIRDEFSDQFDSRRIRWIQPESIPDMRADRLSLIRTLRNLVDNSLKYGGDPLSTIEIGYGETADHYILSVKDNGVGIPEGDEKGLFGLFTRRKNSHGVQGTGLGLAIVKEITERHEGRVWLTLRSRTGTTFHVSLSRSLPLSG